MPVVTVYRPTSSGFAMLISAGKS